MAESLVKVAIKLRPKLENEASKELQWRSTPGKIKSINGKHSLAFGMLDIFIVMCYFNPIVLILFTENIFDETTSTTSVYKSIAKPIVLKALDGFNGTVFAYGQTSSGKTHTMIGDATNHGIITLAVKDIFQQIDKIKDREFLVKIGYIEIYNDKVFDLFDNRKTGLHVYELQGNILINQKEFVVSSEDEVFNHIQVGNKCKRIVETSTNERSSRSHTIFRITIRSQKAEDGHARVSNLYLVDLAGSEKPDLTSPTFIEGLHINKSLLVLGKIIRELAKKNSNLKQVNFRESKLTRILSPALGGNSLTAVICTVSPVALDESYHTLCFAQSAKNTKTFPTFNIARNARNLFEKFHRNSSSLSNSSVEESSKRRKIMTPLSSTRAFAAKKIIALKIKFDPQEETLMLKNQLAAVEKEKAELEEKLKDITEQHEKVIEKKNEAIKVLLENLSVSDNELTKVKIESEKSQNVNNEEIRILEDYLTESQVKLANINKQYDAQLMDKDYELIVMTKLHDEELQTAQDKTAALEYDIELYSKAICEAEMTIKKLESQMQGKLKEETSNIMKKCKHRVKELTAASNQKDETINVLKEEVATMKKERKVSENEELKMYLDLEKHYGQRMQEASHSVEIMRLIVAQLKSVLEERDEEKELLERELEESKALISELQIQMAECESSIQQQFGDKLDDVEKQFRDALELRDDEIQRLTTINRSYEIEMPAIIEQPPSPPFSIDSESSDSAHERVPFWKICRGGRSYCCSYCDKTYLRKAALDRHIQNKHLTHEQRFECNICRDTYKTKNSLYSHKSSTHRDTRQSSIN